METGQYLLLLVVAGRKCGNYQRDWLHVVGGTVRGVKSLVSLCILDWVRFGAPSDPRLVSVGEVTRWDDTQRGAIQV
jgi:hypothetical protein